MQQQVKLLGTKYYYVLLFGITLSTFFLEPKTSFANMFSISVQFNGNSCKKCNISQQLI